MTDNIENRLKDIITKITDDVANNANNKLTDEKKEAINNLLKMYPELDQMDTDKSFNIPKQKSNRGRKKKVVDVQVPTGIIKNTKFEELVFDQVDYNGKKYYVIIANCYICYFNTVAIAPKTNNN